MTINLEFQIYHLITGLTGGLVRGLVGIAKQAQNPDEFKIHWQYFGFTLLVSGIVGVVSGLIADGDWRISLLAGYAGTDFLESLYRLRFPQMFNVGAIANSVANQVPVTNGKAATTPVTVTSTATPIAK